VTSEALRGSTRLVSVRGRPGAVPLGAILAGLGLCAIVAAGALHLDRLPLTLCTFKALTGWACLTCGTTRALARLFELDLAGALAMNPLATVGTLALVPWALADLVLLPRGSALDVTLSPALARVARVAAVALVLANWAYLLAAGR
jgi:hypothetical protein